MNNWAQRTSLLVLLLTAATMFGQTPKSVAAAGKGDRNHTPVDAVGGTITAFEKHSVVMIAEWRHGIKQMGDFYVQLVRDKRFQELKPDLVIEFASMNNQELLDKYIGGENVPIDQVRHIWRDTTKVASWEYPIYAQWLAAIREVNLRLPVGKRFRVLAGDSAIDWNRIRTHEDWAALGDNNSSIAAVITNQVLKSGHEAFVVLGGNHVSKMGTRAGGPNVSTIVEKAYPGSVYAILHYLAPDVPGELASRYKNSALLYDLKGTPFGDQPDPNGVPPIQYTDALLFVGPVSSMTEGTPPAESAESAYVKEVKRRSMIEWGDLRGLKLLGVATK